MNFLRWIADESLLHHFVAGLSTPILLLLVVGFIYEWKKGALEWD